MGNMDRIVNSFFCFVGSHWREFERIGILYIHYKCKYCGKRERLERFND